MNFVDKYWSIIIKTFGLIIPSLFHYLLLESNTCVCNILMSTCFAVVTVLYYFKCNCFSPKVEKKAYHIALIMYIKISGMTDEAAVTFPCIHITYSYSTAIHTTSKLY